MAGDNADDKTVKQSVISNKPWQFQPGQSGNPAGRPPKGETLTELMREFLEQAPEGQKVTYKEAFIKRVYKKAMEEGDAVTIKLIWNYLDGMPNQTMNLNVKDFQKFIMEPDDSNEVS